MFTTLCSMKDNIIFRLCDLRGLCGGKITGLQWSLTTKTERIVAGGSDYDCIWYSRGTIA